MRPCDWQCCCLYDSITELAALCKPLADVAKPLGLRNCHISTNESSVSKLEELSQTPRGQHLLRCTETLFLNYVDPGSTSEASALDRIFALYDRLQAILVGVCPLFLVVDGYNRLDPSLKIITPLSSGFLPEIRLGPQINTDIYGCCLLFGQCYDTLRRLLVFGKLLDAANTSLFDVLARMQLVTPHTLQVVRFETVESQIRLGMGLNPTADYFLQSFALTTLAIGNYDFTSYVSDCLELCGKSLKTLVCDRWSSDYLPLVPQLRLLITRAFDYAPKGTEQTWFPLFPQTLESLTVFGWHDMVVKRFAEWVQIDAFRPCFSYLVALDDKNTALATYWHPFDEIVNNACRERGIAFVVSTNTTSHCYDSLSIEADAGPAMGTEYLIPEGFVSPGPRSYRSMNEVLAAAADQARRQPQHPLKVESCNAIST